MVGSCLMGDRNTVTRRGLAKKMPQASIVIASGDLYTSEVKADQPAGPTRLFIADLG